MLDYAERRTRACLAALPDGVRMAEDVLEAIEGDLVLRLRATVEGERLAARLRRLRPPARRQPQLPARGDALGVLLRRARPHRPRHPALRRSLPAGGGARPGGVSVECAARRAGSTGAGQRAAHRRRRGRPPGRWRGPRGGRRQRRDLLARRRPRARRLRQRAGTGHDEQPDARRRALLLLRDASAAARAPAPTPMGPPGCTWR